LALRAVALRQRGRNFLTGNQTKISKKPAIAGQSRVFVFNTSHHQEQRRKANMNKACQRVPTRFAREVRFELKPAPFRAAQTTALDELKERLLRARLQTVTDPEQNALLRRAANEAAALVWLSPFPLLLFPELLEEKARAAFRRQRHQTEVRRDSENLLCSIA
jgi:hypothetical protein